MHNTPYYKLRSTQKMLQHMAQKWPKNATIDINRKRSKDSSLTEVPLKRVLCSLSPARGGLEISDCFS